MNTVIKNGSLGMALALLALLPLPVYCTSSLHLSSEPHACPVPCNCTVDGRGTIYVVNCSRRNLRHIPSNFPPSTTWLLLNDNQIAEVPSRSMAALVLLQRLDLSNNEIHTLDKNSFAGLSKLQTLSLAFNHLNTSESYPSSVFHWLKTLRILNLKRNCDSCQYPDNCSYPESVLRDVPELTELYLDGIPNIPLGPSFNSLAKLEKLSFNGGSSHTFCCIHTLPPDMFSSLENSSLTSIDLSYCGIDRVYPGTFARVRNLTSLVFTYNRYLCEEGLDNITAGLNETRIQHLYARKICRKPSESREFFRLSKTAFQHISSSNLLHLDLSSNALYMIAPEAILNLPHSLQNFSLRDNELTKGTFLVNLYNLPNLKLIDVSYQNRKRTTQDAGVHLGDRELHVIKQTSKTQSFLDVSSIHGFLEYVLKYCISTAYNNNSMCDYYQYVSSESGDTQMSSVPWPVPPSLEVILASNLKLGLPIPPITFSQNRLSFIDISSYMAREMQGKIRGLHALKTFNLSSNLMQVIHPETFGDMRNLTTLLLQDNRLGQTINDDKRCLLFSNQSSLETLDLSSNGIKELPASLFVQLHRLKSLVLRNNSLVDLGFHVDSLTTLQILDLSNNQIRVVSEQMRKGLDKIAQHGKVAIDLAGNQLQCGCDDISFVSWVASTRVRFLWLEQTWCIHANGSRLPLQNAAEIADSLRQTCIAWIVITSCVLTFFVCLLVGGLVALLYQKRWKLRYLYYMGRRATNPYHSLEEREIDLEYDVYISYERDFCMSDLELSSRESNAENETLHEFVTRILYPSLTDDGFKVLIRDELQSGKMFHDVISGSIRKSRKLLAIITCDYARDFWNIFEINMAAYEGIYTNRKVVVPVVFGKVQSSDFPSEILELLKAEPVLRFTDWQYEQQLLQAIKDRLRR